jgi:hypothetical protein
LPQNKIEAISNHNPEHKKSRTKKQKKKKREQARNSRKRAIRRNKKYVENYKIAHPCSCGEKVPCCLSFHHNNGDKTGTISDMVNRGYSIKRIQSEIRKCDVLCLNCHTKLHNMKKKD